jgi:hypothetical protein
MEENPYRTADASSDSSPRAVRDVLVLWVTAANGFALAVMSLWQTSQYFWREESYAMLPLWCSCLYAVMGAVTAVWCLIDLATLKEDNS